MEDNELFGERHEQEESGLYGKKYAELCDLHNVSNSLDLDKIERKLNEVLDNETSESLKEWLHSKRL